MFQAPPPNIIILIFSPVYLGKHWIEQAATQQPTSSFILVPYTFLFSHQEWIALLYLSSLENLSWKSLVDLIEI